MDEKYQKTVEKRAVLRNIDDFLKKENEPYRSIILILYVASNYNQIFKTMQTMELRELIVGRYHISPKKRDKKRYPIFMKLKKELKKYDDILLNQDIGPKKESYMSKSSDYHRFEAYIKRLEDFGWITRPNKGYIRISNKYMFRPLQQWCSKIITNSSIENTAAWWNSMLFMPAIRFDELNDNEIDEMKTLLHESSNNYYRINQLLNRIGMRKSSLIWDDFKKYFKGSKITLFYYWLQLIVNIYGYNSLNAYYYLLRKNKEHEPYGKSDFEFNFQILDMLRYESYQEKLMTKDIKKWQARFNNLIKKAFTEYIRRKYPKLEFDKLNKNLKDEKRLYDKKFLNMINNLILKWNSIEYSIQISIPEFIRHQALEKHGMKKKSALELDQAIRYLYNNHPFLEKIIYKSIEETKLMRKKLDKNMLKPEEIIRKIESKNTKKDNTDKEEIKPSFFERYDLLKGLSNDIKSLGYKNKKELYRETRNILNAFLPPELPNNLKELIIN